MLTTKACTICITVHLFQQLWPKVIKITKYITNCMLIKKHEWKILYELIEKYFFNFAYFKIYRCKTYNKINIFLKKSKLVERVHIKHLINYNSRNIFYI